MLSTKSCDTKHAIKKTLHPDRPLFKVKTLNKYTNPIIDTNLYPVPSLMLRILRCLGQVIIWSAPKGRGNTF